MQFAFFIAKRYFIAKKSTNVINIISGISILGILISSMALFIILSVFNGFESLVLSLYNKFAPDIKIETAKGKFFDPNQEQFRSIKNNPAIAHYVECLEEKAMLRFGKQQYIATVKGVSNDFLNTKSLDSNIVKGELILEYEGQPLAIVGAGVEYYLGLNINSTEPILLFAPRKNISKSSMGSMNDLNQMSIYTAGVFQVQQDFDAKYAIVPLSFARELFADSVNVSSIELYLKDGAYVDKIQNSIKSLLGSDYSVKNRYEQNELLYKVLNTEKWVVYAILTFVLMIAICNIVGVLTMLIIDKKKDIAILKSMGASQNMICNIFILEGFLIALCGSFLGLALGFLICWLQQTYDLIGLAQSGSFVISAYPIEMHLDDFFLILFTVLSISFVASWVASKMSIRYFKTIREELFD
jgi:lipoprotein-releasing system permease protein